MKTRANANADTVNPTCARVQTEFTAVERVSKDRNALAEGEQKRREADVNDGSMFIQERDEARGMHLRDNSERYTCGGACYCN